MHEDQLKKLHEILNTPIQKGKEVWIADSARVIGNVKLGDECSVWFGAVIRGDRDSIEIGDRTNIQDNVVIHVDPGFPVQIGNDCIIGHSAIVHGARLGNHVLIGMNATVLNGAKIGNFCVIGANSLVTTGMEIPDYTIVTGTPARVRKKLSAEEIEKVKQNAINYVELSKVYIQHQDDSGK